MARPENEPHHMPKMEVAMIENTSLNLTSDDVFLMGKGEWFRSYDKMGAHPCTCDGVDGWHFSVCAMRCGYLGRYPVAWRQRLRKPSG